MRRPVRERAGDGAAASVAGLAVPLVPAGPAVQQQRYLVVDFPATEAGVRNVGAVASLVDQLEELGLR